MSNPTSQIIDTFVVPQARIGDHLSEEIGKRADGRRIVALSTIPNAAHHELGPGIAVVLVTEA